MEKKAVLAFVTFILIFGLQLIFNFEDIYQYELCRTNFGNFSDLEKILLAGKVDRVSFAKVDEDYDVRCYFSAQKDEELVCWQGTLPPILAYQVFNNVHELNLRLYGHILKSPFRIFLEIIVQCVLCSIILLIVINLYMLKRFFTSEKLPQIWQDKEWKMACLHEAGHAVIAYKLTPELIDYVTVKNYINEDSRAKIVFYSPNFVVREDLIKKIAIALGGQLAELHNGIVGSGVKRDLKDVEILAANMVYNFDMGSKKRHQSIATVYLTEDLKHEMNAEIEKIVEEGRALAQKTLSENIILYEAFCEQLQKKRILRLHDMQQIEASLLKA